MLHPTLLLSLTVFTLCAVPVLDAQSDASRQAGSRTRDVHVTALDGKGAPVTDLRITDVAVREDGNGREVLKVGPATAPLTIAILVDDSQAAEPAIQELRRGLTAFIDQMQGKAEIALSTIGERPTPIVEYTTGTEVLKRGVTKIFARQGTGSYLLEGIVAVSKGLQRRERVERPVIIALTVEGVEFSNDYHKPVLDELRRSGATFHALVIGTPGDVQTDELRNRAVVLAEGTSLTGGRREQILAESAIPGKLRQVGEELLNQQVVTYSRPDALIPPEKIEVTSTRPGVTVRATRVAPGR